MKIHCIALTKNEEDVVGYCLTEAAKWADFIYVYDGQSTDRTWDIVRSLASEKIIPWKQDGKVFKEGLRAEVFAAFRNFASEGDWWLQLNVDEFHFPNIRSVLGNIPTATDFVWGIPIEYYITPEDAQTIDFNLPIEERLSQLRHYRVDWSEPRCFRYRKRLVWNSDWAWPRHAGLTAKSRIFFKHYPYRSPQQIQTRLDVRRDNRARGFEGWLHASQEGWKEKLAERERCQFDDGSGKYVIDENVLPNHLEPRMRRLAKWTMHKSGIWP
jgi:hypothetical protein